MTSTRLLTDEELFEAARRDSLYFEVYLHFERDTHLRQVSTPLELDQVIQLAETTVGPNHVWLMVPFTWAESKAKPTAMSDLFRLKEMFTTPAYWPDQVPAELP